MRPILEDGTHFEDAYRRLAPRAQAVAERVLHDRAAAEDVAQEVFMELWRRPSAYRPERGSLSSYVSMLARSRALDRLRTRAAVTAANERALRQSPPHGRDPDAPIDLVLHRERRRQLLGALAHLPEDQRETLLLAFGLGLSTREVAEVVRVPHGTAKSRMRLGLRKARTALGVAA